MAFYLTLLKGSLPGESLLGCAGPSASTRLLRGSLSYTLYNKYHCYLSATGKQDTWQVYAMSNG